MPSVQLILARNIANAQVIKYEHFCWHMSVNDPLILQFFVQISANITSYITNTYNFNLNNFFFASKVENTCQERSSSISNPAPWTPSVRGPSVKFSDQTTSYSGNPAPATTGPRVTIRKVPNLSIPFWTSSGKKPKAATVSRLVYHLYRNLPSVIGFLVHYFYYNFVFKFFLLGFTYCWRKNLVIA